MSKRGLSKLCKFSIATLIVFGFLTAPNSTAQSSDCKKKKDWKVSAYMDGDSCLDQVTFWNLNQMEKIGSNEKMDIIVQLDRCEYQVGYEYNPLEYVPPDSEARRYYVQKDEDMDEINSLRLENFDKEINMGSQKEFEDFFNWQKHADSERRLFVIKGHGYGIMQPLEDILYGKGGDYSNNPLPTSTIDNVFDKDLEGKLDVLIFDSCAMATIEVAYQLREHAHVMVASEAIMWYTTVFETESEKWQVIAPGIEYEMVLDYLTKNPDVDNETLGKFITSSFDKKFKDKNSCINEIPVADLLERQKATLSATNLNNLEAFVDKFEKFSRTLIGRLEDETTREATVEALKKTLKEAQDYMPPDSLGIYTYFDLFDFLEKLDSNLDDKELKNRIKDLDKSSIIIDSVYNSSDVKNSNGLTILFIENFKILEYINEDQPEKFKEMVTKLKEYYNKSDFAKKTGWDKVQELYQKYSN